jgi:hypothetical protein
MGEGYKMIVAGMGIGLVCVLFGYFVGWHVGRWTSSAKWQYFVETGEWEE